VCFGAGRCCTSLALALSEARDVCLATPPTNDGASQAAPPPAFNLSPANMSFAGRPLHGGKSGAVRGLLKAKLLFDVSPLLRWYVSSSV
jgi:hypothetical protein